MLAALRGRGRGRRGNRHDGAEHPGHVRHVPDGDADGAGAVPGARGHRGPRAHAAVRRVGRGPRVPRQRARNLRDARLLHARHLRRPVAHLAADHRGAARVRVRLHQRHGAADGHDDPARARHVLLGRRPRDRAHVPADGLRRGGAHHGARQRVRRHRRLQDLHLHLLSLQGPRGRSAAAHRRLRRRQAVQRCQDVVLQGRTRQRDRGRAAVQCGANDRRARGDWRHRAGLLRHR
mmetsp:Transcript_19157/g.67641  ORF Transcript_19157/g.67641 Transcript_19157/m.67641 type:complete len:235 (+) Transcript_19157:2062-2766(+)